MRPIPVLDPKEIDQCRAAAEVVVKVHQMVVERLRPGVTPTQLDRWVGETLWEHNAKSCFLGYRVQRLPPFPGQACISRNECVVHGHPSNHELPFAQGDLIKVDVGALKDGFIGDAAWTYHLGPPDPSDRALMDAGIASLRTGIAAIKPGGELLDWAVAVQDLVEGQLGLHLVRGFGGHGLGRQLHEAPFIANVRPSYPGEWTECRVRWKPGMLVALEPMIATGTGETTQEHRAWPINIADGSRSVHHEHDVLITETGPEILTEALESLPDELPV